MPDTLPWDQLTNDNPVSTHQTDPVIIVGAGLAGCWMARTLAEKGIRVAVLESGSLPANSASSNPAGIVKPFVSRSPCFAMDFYLQSHQYLLRRLGEWNLIQAANFIACGVVQLVEKPYPESDHYYCVSPTQMKEVLGVKCDAHGLLFEQSGWLNPSALCKALLQHDLIDLHCDCRIEAIARLDDTRWKIVDDEKRVRYGSHVVVCTGAALTQLSLCTHLPVTPARGQISRFANTMETASIKRVISGRHYLIPESNSVIAGATFERDVCDDSLRRADNRLNLLGVKSMLPELQMNANAIEAYAGIRATTPDRLPLVGPIPDATACNDVYADLQHGRKLDSYPALPCHAGAFVLGGLGSRGIVTAPFAAMLLVDHMMGGQQLLNWSALINPARFQIRRLKRATVQNN